MWPDRLSLRKQALCRACGSKPAPGSQLATHRLAITASPTGTGTPWIWRPKRRHADFYAIRAEVAWG